MTAQAFIRLRFDAGEAYRFDWSHEAIELHGLPVVVKVAQMRLFQMQEMVFDVHDEAFAFYGGGLPAASTTT